jgi:hypothetical protein
MAAFRYVGPAEALWIQQTGEVVSRSGVTWYAIGSDAPLASSAEVTDVYALPDDKQYAFGPIPDDECPPWNVVGARTVMPTRLPDGRWVPGGGTEAATSHTFRCMGLRQLG